MIEKFEKSIKITINGKEYHSIEELPPEAREIYQKTIGRLDKDGNGIPDFLEKYVQEDSSPSESSKDPGSSSRFEQKTSSPSPSSAENRLRVLLSVATVLILLVVYFLIRK